LYSTVHGNGNSFVIQLKNGHFIIEDGGKKEDAIYLLEYLESLTPEGEKPVIEAWFITHPHSDHCGAMSKIATTQEYLNRIYVEGFYYYDLSNTMLNYLKLQPGTEDQRNISLYYRAFKTTSGGNPELYRPQFGQRYYFCDLTIDVALTIEQCTRDALDNFDLNDSSTWLMHNIEGQKFLCTGDSNYSTQNTAIFLLDQSYFDMEVFATPHHAINMYDEFVDALQVDTLLYTSFRAGSIWQDGTWKEALAVNDRMRQEVAEYYHYGDGTIILTFPYSVGTAQKLPALDWKYNGGVDGRDMK
jgi:beta-lactamase superfamily II metal-dependent hydrolase